jgi:hypothetical protein
MIDSVLQYFKSASGWGAGQVLAEVVGDLPHADGVLGSKYHLPIDAKDPNVVHTLDQDFGLGMKVDAHALASPLLSQCGCFTER